MTPSFHQLHPGHVRREPVRRADRRLRRRLPRAVPPPLAPPGHPRHGLLRLPRAVPRLRRSRHVEDIPHLSGLITYLTSHDSLIQGRAK